MNENLHNKHLPVTAEMGWQKMQDLLDEHLPVKQKLQWSTLVLPYMAALLLITFMFASLSLNETKKPVHPHHVSVRGLRNTQSSNSTSVKVYSPTSIISKASNIILTKPPETASNQEEKEEPLVGSIANSSINTDTIPNHSTASSTEVSNTDTLVSPGINPLLPPEEAVATKKAIVKKKWSFSAGIAMNVAAPGTKQNLHPYPAIEAKYAIKPKVYVAAGLSIYAPAATSVTGKSKTVYLNDTLNNIRMYNEKTSYNKLHYVDIPIAAGVNINKNLSVQSGVQVSILVDKKQSTSLEHYDFQMNRVAAPVFTSLMGLPTNQPIEYDNKVRKIDYRFTAGIRYNIKKITTGLTYQQGLSPVLKGSSGDKNRNHFFTLSLLYKLR